MLKKCLPTIMLPTLSVALLFLAGCTQTENNVALGTLERDRIALTATAFEMITALPVSEGSKVVEGQLLAQLDTTLQEAAIRKLTADIAAQEAVLEQLQHGPRPQEIAAARARVETAQSERKESERALERAQDLVGKRLAAQADLDTAQTRLESNSARLRDSQAQLDLLLAGTRQEEIARAQAQLNSIRAALSSETQKLANLSIRATRAGTLDSLPFHTGERVNIGSELAIVLAEGAPYARVYIPETSRSTIVIGSTLTIHVDGIGNLFTGTVRWISKDAAFTPYYALNSSERSRLVYMAKVELPASAENLPSGLPVQVELP